METSLEQQIQAHAEQIIKTNMKLKELEKQLDNYFIVSQKYSRLKQLVREIKQILKEVEKPTGIMSYVKNEILQRISEVEE
jgi:chemotaxis regulatin CheY-phosphate phosphatase CheZ